MKKLTIIKALVASVAIVMGVNINANAQLGGLVKAAKGKAQQNKQNEAPKTDYFALKIPQRDANASPCVFDLKDQNAVCMWDPTQLELTILAERGGHKANDVYKLDPATGKFTNSKGESKGSISEDGTVVTPNFGKLMIEPDDQGKYKYYIHWGNTYPGYIELSKNNAVGCKCLKDGISTPWSICRTDDKTVNPLLVTYICYLMYTPSEVWILRKGYDPDKKYTSDEHDDLIEWNDQESIDKIIKYESSLPYAGFREKHPEFKNCKIGGIGLMESQWNDGNNWWYIDYWVVYELADGRNIMTISTARKKFRYGDVENRYRQNEDRFHEVIDRKRK